MKRAALVIGNVGADLPGVEVDIGRFERFLLSPIGGAWGISEVTILRNPSKYVVQSKLDAMISLDYSLVIFAGHGSHSPSRNATQVQISPGVTMDVNELKVGASRHTVIADCCRVLQGDAMREALVAKMLKRATEFDPGACRRLFDQGVLAAAKGVVTLYSCSVGETAGESSSEGGYYSAALLSAAKAFAEGATGASGPRQAQLSVSEAHDAALGYVHIQAAHRQNPVREVPRSLPHFPFAVSA